MGRYRTRWIGLGAGLAILAAIAGGVLVVRSLESEHTSSTTPPSTVAPQFTAARAAALSADLAAGTDESFRRAVVVPADQVLDPTAPAQMRALGPITFAVASFHVLDRTHATVRGTVSLPPAGRPQRWTFSLIRKHDLWMLFDAVPLA